VAWYSGVGKALSSLFGGRRPAPVTAPNGGDGVQAYGGWLTPDERNPALIGTNKWLRFANAHHTAIVATGLRYRCNLLAGAKWSAQANPRGGRDADRGVEIANEGLLNAQMPRTWPANVRKASMFQANGFSLFEWTIRRRPDDGMIVFSELGHRPPHTVQRWDKPSEQESWQAIAQLTRQGKEWIIPRNRLWYCWDDTLTDMPDGVGLLRHVIELVRRLGVLEGLEGVAYETDVRGMPIGRAPIEELRALASAQPGIGTDRDKILSFIQNRTANLQAQLENIVKSPDKLQWLMLDSATYKNANQESVTAVQKWAFDLLKGDGKGLEELDKVIGRLQLEIARVFGIEFVMMGAGSSGSKAMHADKTSMLAASLDAALTEIASSATRDLVRPLVALNGLDPDTCAPTLVAEPVDRNDVQQVAQTLVYLAQAGLQPNDPAINVIRGWSGLPDAPEPDPALMGAMPDPATGEVDVPVDDLEAEDEGEGEDTGETTKRRLIKFDSDQPRAGNGKWTSGGASADASAPKEYNPETGTRHNVDGALGFNGDAPAVLWAHRSGFAAEGDGPLHTTPSGESYRPTITDPESAVHRYIQQPSEFNAAARAGKETEATRRLDSEIAASKVSQAITVYRGVRSGPMTSAGVGDVVHDMGFMSTTPTERRAVNFATGARKPDETDHRPTIIEFDLPKGTPGLWVSDFESEILLGRGYGLRVTSVGERIVRRSAVRVLRAELVSPSHGHLGAKAA
jgi:hypothetical protein